MLHCFIGCSTLVILHDFGSMTAFVVQVFGYILGVLYTFVSVILDCEVSLTVTCSESCNVYNVYAVSVESSCLLLSEKFWVIP